jgi:phosphoglycerate dehydrogenase-like enzyme
VYYEGRRAPDAFIDEHLPNAIAVIGQPRLDKERLDRAPHLLFVANVESNFQPDVDYAECHRRGIHVVSTAPVFAQPVAEMALAMALGAVRSVPLGDAQMRAGTEVLYDEGVNENSMLLHGKTLGIIGLGNLGRALLPLLRPFGGPIFVHDPWIHPAVLQDIGVEPVSADTIFERSLVLFILAATTSENQGAFGARHFAKMARGSVLVAISRAGVLDFDALLDAADCGHIRAAIDVFPEEPLPPNHRVRSTRNTVLSAHRAGNVPEIWQKMGEIVVDDLELVLRGLAPQRCQRAQIETVSKLRSKPIE